MKKAKQTKEKKKAAFTFRGLAKVINLQETLEKAGKAVDAKVLAKEIFLVNIAICIILSVVIIIEGFVLGANPWRFVLLLTAFWLIASWLLLGLLWVIYLFYLDMLIYKRTREVEQVFPDFLELASANLSSGMPIDRALWYAIRPNFGVLAKEIEVVAKSTIAGEDLGDALRNFATKYDSKVIQRSINLILEGLAAGGELSEILSKIALDIEETRILKRDMAASVTTYVIFITFATIGAAPVLLALSTQLLSIIGSITSSLGPSLGQSGPFQFTISGDSIKVSDFKIFSVVTMTIGSIMAASIVNIIQKGRIRDGLMKIPVFIIISLVIYFISEAYMASLFAAMF